MEISLDGILGRADDELVLVEADLALLAEFAVGDLLDVFVVGALVDELVSEVSLVVALALVFALTHLAAHALALVTGKYDLLMVVDLAVRLLHLNQVDRVLLAVRKTIVALGTLRPHARTAPHFCFHFLQRGQFSLRSWRHGNRLHLYFLVQLLRLLLIDLFGAFFVGLKKILDV